MGLHSEPSDPKHGPKRNVVPRGKPVINRSGRSCWLVVFGSLVGWWVVVVAPVSFVPFSFQVYS